MSPIGTYREQSETNGFTLRTLVCVLQQYRRFLGPAHTCFFTAESLYEYVLLAMVHALQYDVSHCSTGLLSSLLK